MWTLCCIMALLFASMTNNISFIYSSAGTIIILILLHPLILLWQSLPRLNCLLWPLWWLLEWFRRRRTITLRLRTIKSRFRSSSSGRLPNLKSVASPQLKFMLSFPGFTKDLTNSGVIKHSNFSSDVIA